MVHPLELIHPRSLRQLSDSLAVLVRGELWLQVLIALFLGVLVGILLGPSVGWVETHTAVLIGNWLALPGKLFLALIQMVVVPLVVASVIRGLAASEDMDQLRRTGLRVGLYFTVTTAFAIVIGMTLAAWIEPGRYIDAAAARATFGVVLAESAHAPVESPGLDTLPQLIITLLPTNPLDSLLHGQMLQIVLFALIAGVALVTMAPEQSRPLLDLLGSLLEVCMTIVRWAMWLAPLAVFGLIAQLAARTGLSTLGGMAVYVGTVLLGLLVVMALYLLLVYLVSGRRPLAFLRATRDVLLLAFSTSSSATVMPLSIRTAEDRLAVRPSISQFVIPIGATINMNGTALYQGVATLFLAQVFGVDIGTSGLLLIVVIAVGASIGSPGTPGVGMVILAAVLATVGIPAAAIALLMGVDRILDMSRTAVNVAGDLTACVLMDRWVGGKRSLEAELAEQSAQEWQRSVTKRDVIVQPPSTPGGARASAASRRR
jgi:Na+/H+-dicarboxylate symporter